MPVAASLFIYSLKNRKTIPSNFYLCGSFVTAGPGVTGFDASERSLQSPGKSNPHAFLLYLLRYTSPFLTHSIAQETLCGKQTIFSEEENR